MSAAAKIVVLDDDPTGTQTVHDVAVLTEWSEAALAAELARAERCFYVLTNSRAFSTERAVAVNREIGRNLVAAQRSTGVKAAVVSRSDSTLRGHFPAETDALAEALGGGFDATLLVPAFFEGGRVTRDDVHYVAGPGGWVPAGETEFARDARFGYRASNLREWVEEKTGGRVRAGEVVSVTLGELRGGGERVAEKLGALRGGAVAIANAEEADDLRALVRGLRAAEAKGKRFLFRTAASFVAAYAGIERRALLRAEEIAPAGRGGGLVVAGSHVGRTSAQLQRVLSEGAVEAVEVAVEELLAGAGTDAVARRIDEAVGRGRNAVVYTSRKLVTGRTAAENVAIGETISGGLVRIVAALRERPRWLVAKGGITSSDIATRALGVRRAMVLGQALPGVPVWRLGGEAKWPGLGYVVFPGNVGGEDALVGLVAALG